MLKIYILHLEWNKGYRPHVSLRRKPKAGDRVLNGGEPGTLLTCDTCSGTGTLHQPDWLREAVKKPSPQMTYEPPLRIVLEPFTEEGVLRRVGDIVSSYNRAYEVFAIAYDMEENPTAVYAELMLPRPGHLLPTALEFNKRSSNATNEDDSPETLCLGISLSHTPHRVGQELWTRGAQYVITQVVLGDYMILTRKEKSNQ